MTRVKPVKAPIRHYGIYVGHATACDMTIARGTKCSLLLSRITCKKCIHVITPAPPPKRRKK